MPMTPNELVQKAYHASMLAQLGPNPVYTPIDAPELAGARKGLVAAINAVLEVCLFQADLVRQQYSPAVSYKSVGGNVASWDIIKRLEEMRPA